MVRTSEGKILRPVNQEVQIGKIFENLTSPYGVAEALKAVLNAKHKPASTATILSLRTESDFKDPLVQQWHTGMTELDIVQDKAYVTPGGLFLADPERIRSAVESGPINYAARLTPGEIESLLKKDKVTPISYEEFVRLTDSGSIPEPYTVMEDRNKLAKLPNDYMKLAKWAKDPRAIMYTGGRAKAEAYADYLGKNEIKTAWLSMDSAEGEDRARLLFVNFYYYNFGVDGNYYLGSNGRFVGVAPEAQLVEKNNGTLVSPSLEQVLAVTGDFTAPANRNALRAALAGLYHQ